VTRSHFETSCARCRALSKPPDTFEPSNFIAESGIHPVPPIAGAARGLNYKLFEYTCLHLLLLYLLGSHKQWYGFQRHPYLLLNAVGDERPDLGGTKAVSKFTTHSAHRACS